MTWAKWQVDTLLASRDSRVEAGNSGVETRKCFSGKTSSRGLAGKFHESTDELATLHEYASCSITTSTPLAMELPAL